MKKYIQILTLLFLSMCFVSCSNDDDEPFGFYEYETFGGDIITGYVKLGGTLDAKTGGDYLLIRNGSGSYSVESSDKDIATVSLSGSSEGEAGQYVSIIYNISCYRE